MPATTVLMVRPLTFCSNQETISSNSFQKDAGTTPATEIVARAQEEFDEFQEILTANGIAILRFDEVPGAETPDACFPNNWFCQLPDGKVFVFPMQAKSRRREVRKDILDRLVNKGLFDLTHHVEKDLFLEGTGSLILDHENKLAYACLSPRTSPEMLREFGSLSGYKAVPFSSFDKNGTRVYHTNVMMALGEKTVVINLSSVTDEKERGELLRHFQETGKTVVDISHAQMNYFAGNMLFLANTTGKKFWVMSTRAWSVLSSSQRRILETEGKLIHSPIPTIEDHGGGGVRCLMAEIFVSE